MSWLGLEKPLIAPAEQHFVCMQSFVGSRMSSGKRRRKRELCLGEQETEHSALWLLLMQKFSLGLLSASEVQALASAACQSGANANDLLGLAALGAHGNNKQNCHRDLVKKHFGNLSSPNPKMVKCDLNCRNADGQLAAASKEVPVLLPHDWVDALDQPLALRQPFPSVQSWAGKPHLHISHHQFFQYYIVVMRSNLLESMTADKAALQAFWHQQQELGVLDSTFFQSFDWEEELPVPWNLHGDGAPYSEVDSLKIISMRCPLSDLEVQHSQLMLAALPK